MTIDFTGLCPREISEKIEVMTLAPQAAKSAQTRGRLRYSEPCPYRTEYQRDRDRILHCKAFRRLADKTQVFIQSTRTDHMRTRLTHTLEMCQVARTIARALRLNEDLVEAIAMGHDLGHSPFGHSGEAALNKVYHEYDPKGHFHHAEHGVRVVDKLEHDGKGLNLTMEVRDGILKHSKGDADWVGKGGMLTLEGQLVALCDRIAYSSHDIDDALNQGILTLDELPDDVLQVLGLTHSTRLTAMVEDVIAASSELTAIKMSPDMTVITNKLKTFMYETIYTVRSMPLDSRLFISDAIQSLFHHFMEYPENMHCDPDLPVPARARLVCDLVAGMTDNYAVTQFEKICEIKGYCTLYRKG
ncbi:MAG: deoxyguanosinetriphosphate triphosphohydrolase [bacterium]